VADPTLARLASLPLDLSVGDMMKELDRHLRGSRGVAMLLMRFEDSAVEAVSVGNVEIRGVGQPFPLLLTAGVVGSGRLPRLRVLACDIEAGQRFLAFTDGISARFDLATAVGDPNEVCQALLGRHRRPYDDATLMIVDMENEI